MVGFGYVSIASASQEWFGGGGGYLTKSQTFKPMRSMRCMSHAVGKIIRSSSTFFISGGYLRTVVIRLSECARAVMANYNKMGWAHL